MRVALGDFLELNLRVRSADDARLQTIFGFWPAFLVAFALRLVGLFKFPFLDEEDRMMRVAVNGLFGYGPQSGQAPFWENLLFRTPLSNSQAITPLWWWTEYVARLVVKDETLSARLPALLTGLIGLALFYWLARQLFPFPIPALLAWLLAVHDVFLWVGTKAQYVESFIFALSVLIAWALLVAQGKWRPFVVAVLASTTAMGFFLLKGMTLTFNALAVGVAQTALLRGGGRRLNFETIVQRAIFAGLIVTPLAVWLLAAQAYITAHYQVRVAELGYFRGIADILYALTFGYGTGRTASLVGPPYFALITYSQGDAWPTSTFLFPLMLAGFGLALRELVKKGQAASAKAHIGLYVVLGIALTLTPVVRKGSFGERYHILYLVATLLAVGLTLEQMWRGENGRGGWLIGLTGIYVGIGLSWADWVNGVLRPGWPFAAAAGVGIGCGAVYGLSRSAVVRRGTVVAVIGLAVLLSLARGPLRWGQFAAFGPEPNSWILERIQEQYHPGVSD